MKPMLAGVFGVLLVYGVILLTGAMGVVLTAYWPVIFIGFIGIYVGCRVYRWATEK